MQLFKRQQQDESATRSVPANGAQTSFPNPQPRSFDHKADDQRLSVESGFRRMIEQHDRARATVLTQRWQNWRS